MCKVKGKLNKIQILILYKTHNNILIVKEDLINKVNLDCKMI